jgi:hypothetical protein
MLDLCPVQPGDAPALHAFLSDSEVARWLRPKGVSGPFTLEECEAMAARDAAHWGAHGFKPWLAWDEEVPAGWCLTYERGFEHAGYPHVLHRTIRERTAP